MTDLIIFAVLAVVLFLAARYIFKAKKSGAKCIGCPAAKQCISCCSCSCGEPQGPGIAKDFPQKDPE